MYCYKNGNDCPYRKTCKQRTSDGECYKMCIDFNEIDLMMHNANIPHKYVQPIVLYPSCKEDVESFEILSEIKKNIAAMVEQGFNLYIKSNQRQNGKTSWGIKILQNYIHHLIGKPGSKDRALYLDLNEYLRELKLSFDSKDKEFKETEKVMRECDLLVLDGIDEVRLSEYERNYLKMIIKSRLANNLSNIFIGRNTADNLINAVGNDLKYYVEDNSTVISIYGIRGDK
jgi:DNA replication protein DnaC